MIRYLKLPVPEPSEFAPNRLSASRVNFRISSSFSKCERSDHKDIILRLFLEQDTQDWPVVKLSEHSRKSRFSTLIGPETTSTLLSPSGKNHY